MEDGGGFVGAQAPIGPEDLDWIEKEFGFTFPRDLREHYLACNGGRPRRPAFRKGDEVFIVRELFPVRHGPRHSLLEDACQDLLRDDEAIVDCHLIPFACDNQGDYYCFSARPEDFGAIYSFRCDGIDDPDEMIRPVAPSFREFIAGLR